VKEKERKRKDIGNFEVTKVNKCGKGKKSDFEVNVERERGIVVFDNSETPVYPCSTSDSKFSTFIENQVLSFPNCPVW
jgi:hypothetical protein